MRAAAPRCHRTPPPRPADTIPADLSVPAPTCAAGTADRAADPIPSAGLYRFACRDEDDDDARLDKMSVQAQKPDWIRPPGPLRVWKIIDGYEMLPDGTCSPIKISIQEIPPDRHEEVIEHMCTYFMNEDPICKSLRTKDDPKRRMDTIALWRHCLQQGLVVGAFTIDYFGRLSKLAGVNMLLVITDYSELSLVDIVKKFSSPLSIRLFKIYYELSLKADVCKIFGVDKYIYATGLSVAPAYRGQKLGQRLLEARTDIGRYYGIKATSSTFTSPVAQILAERAGFKVAHTQYYANVMNKDGTPVYPNIEAPDMKIMIKKIE